MGIVFLTGGTGFVGGHAASHFAARGWSVRALVRDAQRARLLPPGVTPVPGKLDRPETFQDALRGCDAVMHIAGAIRGRNLLEYRQVNVGGTAGVVSAAASACPGAMFVHVSSQSAAGPAWAGECVRECDPPRPISWYGQSKLEGEEIVAKNWMGPWVIIRPSVVYGPADKGLLELFSVVAKGFAPMLAGGDARVQLLAVEDLACILFMVAHRPDLAGRRFFAAGPTVTTGELVRHVAAMRRPAARIVPVPAWAVQLAGAVEAARVALGGSVRTFNRDKVREILQRDWICDAQGLRRELGLGEPPAWTVGIRDACRWYVEHGWLPGCFEMM